MLRSRIALIVVPVTALAISSCDGTTEGLAPVTGKVVCNGQPAAGAILFFHRQSGGPAPPTSVAGVIPSAIVREDGAFTVESASLGRGAAPGQYTVLVQWPEPGESAAAAAGSKTKNALVKGKAVVVAKHDKQDALPADRLKGRYADASKPRLTAEIKSRPTDLGTLEITLN
jgi:hypothetical protein